MLTLVGYSSDIENKIASHRITSCIKGRLFYFFQGRNAWHWSWSVTYPGDNAFSLTLEESIQKVEKNRVQGSTWWIEDIPVCVFSGSRYSLVIGEIGAQAPLQNYVNVKFDKPTIKIIANAFQAWRPNSLVKFVCSVGKVDISRGVLKRFKSVSNGGNYYLEWELKKDKTYNSNYINKIIEKSTKQLKRV